MKFTSPLGGIQQVAWCDRNKCERRLLLVLFR